MAKRDSQWLKCLNVYEFDLQRYRDNALGLRTFKCSLALPHDTFATMAELHEEAFKRVFIGDADLKHFWHRVQNEDWFQRHPFRDAVLDAPHKAVPCRLHGDDADVNKNYNFLALNYSSVVVLAEETAVHKVGIGLLPLKNLAPDSLEQWYEPVVHSMWAAAEGKFPDVDHEGKPWTDLKRRARAGDPFRHGYRLIWIETVGDWKWLKESHQLPQHYGKEEICHMCCACKSGPLRFTDMSDDPAYELPENQRTQPAFVDAHGGRLPALCRLPGWGVTDSLRGDWQHECSLGVGQSAVGSALTELVDGGLRRSTWQLAGENGNSLKGCIQELQDIRREPQAQRKPARIHSGQAWLGSRQRASPPIQSQSGEHHGCDCLACGLLITSQHVDFPHSLAQLSLLGTCPDLVNHEEKRIVA